MADKFDSLQHLYCCNSQQQQQQFLQSITKCVKQIFILEMVHIVDVPQNASINQMASILPSFNAILCQTDFNHPINKPITVENFPVNFNAPTFILSDCFAACIQMIIGKLVAHMFRLLTDTIPVW